jgi:hypothetical protein
MELTLRLASAQLANLRLIGAARSGTLCLRGSLLAGSPLYLLAFYLIGNALGICHQSLVNLSLKDKFQELRGVPAGQTSPPASSRHAVEIVL